MCCSASGYEDSGFNNLMCSGFEGVSSCGVTASGAKNNLLERFRCKRREREGERESVDESAKGREQAGTERGR